MMRVNIVDVICLVSDGNVPVGHEEKAIKQAAMLLDCEKGYTIGRSYQRSAYGGDITYNPFTVKATDPMFIKYMKCIVNSIFAICRNEDDMLWFICINEAVLWTILMMPKRGKYLITTYIDWNQKLAKKQIGRRVRQVLLDKALGKVDLVIATNPHYHVQGNHIHLPDFYLDRQYRQYIRKQKAGVVCVGVMNESQGILEIAKAFRDSGGKIVISGYFRDEEYYQKVRRYSSELVVVENVVLSYEEYIKRIGEAKYVVIPYRDSHVHKTSGVLQETIALNSIPVSFPAFLAYNNAQGITFERYAEIPARIKAYETGGQTVQNDWRAYDYDLVKKKYGQKISELMNTVEKGAKKI